MKRNNFFSRFIVVTLTAALLLVSGSRAIRVSALAVGPLADPVYDTEIFAFKEYVEQNLDAPQLDIMFFLIGGLAVAQMGAQDAQLISPYPNEENIKEWIINCGIQLYNSVIGLVPEGDYYMGIPSIGTPGTKGVPRQVIKALVAQMMGDAVVAINYRDLDDFLTQNPNELLIPFNPDLQLGVNAVFGLNGGAYEWQFNQLPFTDTYQFQEASMSGTLLTEYNNELAQLSQPRYLGNAVGYNNNTAAVDRLLNLVVSSEAKYDFFIDTNDHYFRLVSLNGIRSLDFVAYYSYRGYIVHDSANFSAPYFYYDPQNFDNLSDIVEYAFTHVFPNSQRILYFPYHIAGESGSGKNYSINLNGMIRKFVAGYEYDTAEEITNISDLNYDLNNIQYYESVQNDYLLDIRGLIGDLVNYVYVRQPVFDNIYDLEGNNIIPILVKISTAIENITDLVAPPVPVNLNDIAELTDNTYLERVKEHARNAGDIFANYVAFWHNCDSDLVYTVFGAAILVLVGAFVGKWGHS